MKENSESALSTSKEAISNATRNLMESSILAQDERWRHALHMQVGREVVFPVADGSGKFSAMGKSLTEQCRVEVEGLRVVNFFSRRRSNDGIRGISIG
ncbi:hypothetical protein Ahy_B10g103409 [Arachis hypogaea]|uniref:Uncharacterized protein n=1 Tax=Arachis hypogaea TaxID=3818 RepID=A0A444X3T4_ARAHY|nr:hypothetical protein Ahy_B10g103409 [Arachis hypogaea]